MPPTRMSEISTIYHPQGGLPHSTGTGTQRTASTNTSPSPPPPHTTTIINTTPNRIHPTPSAPIQHGSMLADAHSPSPSTNTSRRVRNLSPPHLAREGRGFQIRQGSFKLNALRLPSTVARFVIMQVIFSCGCALLGILSVAFRCWMAYLCIPVIVGALELLIGIVGYTAIKRPRKKALVKFYFVGCLFGSLAALGLVIFSIIAAATEDEYECLLLPNTPAQCNVVRGARFAIELTTIIVGISEIVVTQVMFMIMCYGSCSPNPAEESRNRPRDPRSVAAEEIPANLELPSYDDHHNYPTSPFHEGAFFINPPPPSTGVDPPSYTNIGLINDELPGGFTPLAAALAQPQGMIPSDPPPPYTLYASSVQATSRGQQSRSIRNNGERASGHRGVVPSVDQNQELAPPQQHPSIRQVDDVPSRASVDQGSGAFRTRDLTIHQSLRLNSDPRNYREWGSRSAHQQRHVPEHHASQTGSSLTSEDDPSILPPELYRDEIRRSGHRYSLSDPTLLSRNARNRVRTQPALDGSVVQSHDRNGEQSDVVLERERDVVATHQRETESHPNSGSEHGSRESRRRRQVLPPPYEGRHNVVRTHSGSSSIDGRYVGPRDEDEGNVNSNPDLLESDDPAYAPRLSESQTLPSDWRSHRADGDDAAIYETIPSPHLSPSRDESPIDGQRPRDLDLSRNSTNAAEGLPAEEEQRGYSRHYFRSDGGNSQGRSRNERSDGRGRYGSRSWDECAYSEERLPDVVDSRPGSREQPQHHEDRGSTAAPQTRPLPDRQPPPYGARRVPSYAPPPYKSRNRSLPNYARRPHVASLTQPPYQRPQHSQQRNEDREQTDRHAPDHGHWERCESPEYSSSQHNDREVTERVGFDELGRTNQPRERCEGTYSGESNVLSDPRDERCSEDRMETFRDAHQSVVSHSLPRPTSLSSTLTIAPPSSMSSRRNIPPSRQVVSSAAPPSRGVPVGSSSFSPSVQALASSTSTRTSSGNAVSPRSAQRDLLARISATSFSNPPPCVPSSSLPARSVSYQARNRLQEGEERGCADSSRERPHTGSPLPIAAVGPPQASLPRPKPLRLNRPSPHMSSANRQAQPTAAPVPLHPRSMPTRPHPPQQGTSSQEHHHHHHHNQHHHQSSSKPVLSGQTRSAEGKPAAEIHPFRTVRSTPVKPHRAYVATKALANALQKGQLSDFLEDYEETII